MTARAFVRRSPWIVLAAIVYLAADGCAWYSHWRWRLPLSTFRDFVDRCHCAVLLLMAGIHGMDTVASHPALLAPYRRWLATTPWSPQLPLPLGPVRLDWRKVLALGCLVAIARFHAHVDPILLVLVFTGARSVLAAAALRATRENGAMLVVLFLVPAMIVLGPHPWLALAAAVAVTVATEVGIARSLARFPWDFPEEDSLAAASRGLGWPLAHISPQPPAAPMSMAKRAVISLLVGWWTFMASTVSHLETKDAALFGAALGIVLAAFRWALYCAHYRSPISLLGRFATGHLILPGYDKVLLAPLITLAMGFAAPPLLARCGARPALTLALTVSLLLTMCLSLGPSLRQWRLTGFHRIAR